MAQALADRADGELGARVDRDARAVRNDEARQHRAAWPDAPGLFQALAQQQLKRDAAISVTNFFAAAEMVAVIDYCATLPSLICRQLMHDPRLKILPAPVDLGSFPVEMAWHVRYRHDPAHRWLQALIGEVITDFKDMTGVKATPSPA